MKKADQVGDHGLDIVGIQESCEKDGAEAGCEVEEYARMGIKRKGRDPKVKGAGRARFLVQEYLCDIIEVKTHIATRAHVCGYPEIGKRKTLS